MSHPTDVIGYVYNADTCCPSCIATALNKDWKVSKAKAVERLLTKEEWGDPIFADAESDTPMHCCQCHAYLGGQLTDAGVRYVIEYLEGYINNGHGDPPTLDTWAKELHDYSLDSDDKQTLAVYEGIRNFQQHKRNKMVANLVPIPARLREALAAYPQPPVTTVDTSALEMRLLSEYMHAHEYAASSNRGRTPHRFPL